MSFESRGEAVVAALDPAELKVIYRVLHAHLTEHPELLDTDFLLELQNHLQIVARAEGVDTSDHGAWDRWLSQGHLPPCADRVRRRFILEGD
jgi:hypothetical protein